MATPAAELYDTRVSRGTQGRLTVFRRFKVDLTQDTGTIAIGPEMAPYAFGVPQLGTSDDFRDATVFGLGGGGLVPLTTRVRMVGFETQNTSSPATVFVTCEFDNFTLGKLKTIHTTATMEEWPIYQKVPYGADVSSGSLSPRYLWSLQTRKSPTSRTIMQVRMRLKTLPQILINQLASQAGKIHQLDSSVSGGSTSSAYWLFEGAQAQQMGEATSGADTSPVWDITYQWHNDPGFHLPDEGITEQAPLFAASSSGGRGGMYNPEYAVVPHRFSLANPDLRTRGQIAASGDSFTSGFFRWRFPFEQYIKIPQYRLEGDPASPPPEATRPDLVIMPRVNEDLQGWINLPGRPLG